MGPGRGACNGNLPGKYRSFTERRPTEKIEIIAINGTDDHGREVRMQLENPAGLQDFVEINGRIKNATALLFTDEDNERKERG